MKTAYPLERSDPPAEEEAVERQDDKVLASAKFRAWATEPEERTPEQQELLSRPEIKVALKALDQRLAPSIRKFRDGVTKLMLERPEAFDDPELVRATARAYRHGGEDAIRDLHPIYERGGRQAVIAAVATSAAARRATQRGHAPRVSNGRHRRGSRRGTRSSSSSSDDPGGEPDLDHAARVCRCGCGQSIEHLRADAKFLNAAHKSRAFRRAQSEEGFEPLAVIPRPCDDCPHPTTLPDEDGDPVCVLCGVLVGTPSRPNGYEVVLGLMITDADGQYRRKLRRPQKPRGRWSGLCTRLPSDPPVRPTLSANNPAQLGAKR